jgi:undecaprenyl-diphosphatase
LTRIRFGAKATFMQFLQLLDESVFRAINGHLPSSLQTVALGISWLGSAAGIAGWLLVIFAGMKRAGTDGAGFCGVAAGLAAGCAWLAKHIVGRDRPWMTLSDVSVAGPHELNGSFPSAHSTMSFALATAVALRWPKTAPFAFFVASLVALSRIAVGMHWPSDVLAGALLGMGISTLLAIAWPRPEGVLGRRVVIG